LYGAASLSAGFAGESPVFGKNAFTSFPPSSFSGSISSFSVSPDQRWIAVVNLTSPVRIYRAYRADPTAAFGSWTIYTTSVSGASYSKVDITNSGMTCFTAFSWPNGGSSTMYFDCFGAGQNPNSPVLYTASSPQKAYVSISSDDKFACIAMITYGVYTIPCFTTGVTGSRRQIDTTGVSVSWNGLQTYDHLSVASNLFHMKFMDDGHNFCYIFGSTFAGMKMACYGFNDDGTVFTSPYAAAATALTTSSGGFNTVSLSEIGGYVHCLSPTIVTIS
jgi:hypothetical protein